jgi:hypothetical protein
MFLNSSSSRMISALIGALASARSTMREKRSVSGDRSTTTATTNMKKSCMTADAGTDERDNINHYDNGQLPIDCIQFITWHLRSLHFLGFTQRDTSQLRQPLLRKKFEDDTMGTQRRFHDFTIQLGECMIAPFGADGGWVYFEPSCCDSGMVLMAGMGGARKTTAF